MSIFLTPFQPAIKLMGKTSYVNKMIAISFFLFLPLLYSSYLVYNNFQVQFEQSANANNDLKKNHRIYQMIVSLQVLENDGTLYIRRNNALDVMQLEASEKKALASHVNLLEMFDDKKKEVYASYYERANFALINKDENSFAQQVYAYQHRLLKELSTLKLDYLSTHNFSISDMSYLLSVELPYSSMLTTELKILRSDKYEKRKLLMKTGELKASVNKVDLILHQFSSYKDSFEESSLKYQRLLQQYTKLILNKETAEAEAKEKALLEVQFNIFNALEELLKKELVEQQDELNSGYQFFMFFMMSMFFFGLYLLVGAYLNFHSSLQSFVSMRTDVSKGKFTSRIQTNNSDEMGLLSHEFNEMIEELDYNHALFDEYQRAVGSSALIVKTDINGLITYVNKAFEQVSGYSKEELIGQTHSKMRSSSTSYEKIEELWDTILNNRVYKTVFENIAKNGKSFYVESTIVPVLDRKGNISEFISIMLDITPMRKQKKTLQAQLYKDKLTSLPNRMKLIEDITKTEQAKLIIINIDEFKEINTIFGEDIGDETLQKMSVAIKDALQTHFLQLYRLSGDEFAILTGKEMSIEHFTNEVKTLSTNLGITKFHCGNHEVSIRLTIGAVLAELHLSSKPLISMADMAMREAKRKSKPYVFYQEIANVEEDLENNYKMVQLIERAIKEDKVRCCYQGIINAKTGHIDKYETLMRIDDEDGNLISPGDFISIAKRARYYPKLTQKVFQEAVFTFVKRTESFTVNLSIDDIMDDNTHNFILDILKNCGCADRIVFEFLETEEIEFNERMLEFTSGVRKLGAKISIDDFGSGYSNYAYLMKLGVDILKIDATLIQEIDTNENCRLITQSIIDIAQALGMQTVAEHVHTKEIAELVTHMGVDYLQGFYLHKPSCDI